MKVNAISQRLVCHPLFMFAVLIGSIFMLAGAVQIAQAQSDTVAQEQEVNGYDYTVQPGDNWSSVAARTGLSVAELKAANPRAAGRGSGWLIEGERLFIPVATKMMTTTHVVQPGESWSVIAKQYGISQQLLKAANPRSLRPNDVLYRNETLFIPVADEAGADAAGADEAGADVASTATPDADATVGVDGASSDEISTADATATAEATAIPTDEAVATEDATSAVDEATATAEPTPEEMTPEETTPTEVATEEAPTATPEALACPTTADEYPTAILSALANTGADTGANTGGSAEVLSAFLTECGALEPGTVANQDLTGDGVDDFVVVYTTVSAAESTGAPLPSMDLLILNSGADGYTVGHQARAESEVQLLSAVDVNEDGQADVVWTETTCGASDCFQTIQIYSWDGTAWRDWSAEKVTMANAEVRLEDSDEAGQGFELMLDGGVYASAGAGPQRARQEVWGSVDGAPYTRLTTTVAESNCLYHTVLDANSAFLNGTEDDFAAAEALYTQAISDETLVACGTRADEIAELRSFSTFRLALISAYRGKPLVAADLAGSITSSYPDSTYDQLGQSWLTAYQENYDIGAGCGAANRFAADNPAAVAILDDYGYANPTFAVQDICPILDLEVPPLDLPTPEPTPEPPTATPEEEATVEATAIPAEEAATEEATPEEAATEESAAAADAGTDAAAATDAITTTVEGGVAEDEALADDGLPVCPENLAGYATALATLLTTAAGDPLIVETWLRSCDAMSDERGSFRLTDLNGDRLGDAIFMPTIVSDLGFGRDGAQGAVLLYHGKADGSYELVDNPEIYGEPRLLTIDDLNNDRVTDIAWSVEGCSSFCVLEVQVVSWAGDAYTSTIEPGATIAEGSASFESVPSGSAGSGQQLMLVGGVSGTADGGLAVPHTEIWQSINRTSFQRVSWRYDRTVEGNDCLGLRLVEADVALQASAAIGYDPAIKLYTESIDPTLTACSLYGMAVDDELMLLQGLASFRLIQTLALSGDFVAAGATLQSLQQGQPDSDYTTAADQWFSSYESEGDAVAACEEVFSIFEENEELWQITDNYGYNHPALAAEQICYVPASS